MATKTKEKSKTKTRDLGGRRKNPDLGEWKTISAAISNPSHFEVIAAWAVAHGIEQKHGHVSLVVRGILDHAAEKPEVAAALKTLRAASAKPARKKTARK